MELIEIQKKHSLELNSRWVGLNQDILIENLNSKKNELIGRNDANVLVYCDNNNNYKIGEFVSASITAATPHGLKGTI